jgi:rhomboid protease GluP
VPQGGELALPYQWQWHLDRWKNSLSRFFGRGEKQPRPKMCPACGALVGINATRCHQCGASTTYSLAAMSRGLSKLFGGRAPVTTILLVTNVLMFGATWMATASMGGGGGLSILWGMGGEASYRLGDVYPPAIFGYHQWYRLVTAMFLHGGLIHIGFNMMVLMDIGPVVEEVYGSARFLFLYTVAGVSGFLLSALAGHRSLGASGAILGLIGVMIAITTKRAGMHMKELRSRLVSWVVSIFVIGFLMPGIDNWAHFGGLASGFLLGKIFADRQPATAAERRTAYALGWLAAMGIVASFALMILHYRDPLPGT